MQEKARVGGLGGESLLFLTDDQIRRALAERRRAAGTSRVLDRLRAVDAGDAEV